MRVFISKLMVSVLIAGTVAGSSPRPPLEDEPGWNCHTQGNRICGSQSI